MQFSANLSFLYQDRPFLERFGAAARDGFKGVEYLEPYAVEKQELVETLREHALQQVLFNVPSGDWQGGERGIACLPDRIDEFRDGVLRAIDFAKALGCKQVNVISGLVPAGSDVGQLESVLVDNLKFAARHCGGADIKLLIEPINTVDIPGFFLSSTAHAERILDEVGSDNLFIQYDFYHMQIMQGNLMSNFRRLKDRIAHVQIADNPGRNEPGTGEINYRFIFKELERCGYSGWVGCEYKPLTDTSAGLGWIADHKV